MIAGSVGPAFLDAGTWSACFGESFAHLLLHDMTADCRCFRAGSYLREMCGTGGIPDGRNTVCAAFLDRTEGEWLWFVDTDMGFDADTVDRLVASADPTSRPVVGGLCFAHRRTGRTGLRAQRYAIVPTLYRFLEHDGEVGFAAVDDWPRGELVQVGGTGAACLLIHRSALERVREKHGDQWFSLITHPHGLGTGKPRTFSEDFSFAVRLAGVGIPLWVDTAVKTTHHKGECYLDEEAFDAERGGSTVKIDGGADTNQSVTSTRRMDGSRSVGDDRE